ncbi:hypothetical protein ACFFGV_04755 [Pontibacillus salicampi]|uniref:Uncharacterized protein n=1 Tax=Pontibacillus salicampi TaxID=1449801 RepID=A0ABV6LKH4_9BACI
MHGVTYFYALSAIGLMFFIPYLIIKDCKRKQSITSLFNSIALPLVWLFVALGEVLKTILSDSSMETYNQIFFLGLVVFIVCPLVMIILFNVKKDYQKWGDPKEYKYEWLYKVRYLLVAGVGALFLAALYQFYQIFDFLF